MDDLTPSGGDLRPGSTFAGLRIERELGRGGSGVVYLAHDESLDRAVALKVLHRNAMGDDPAALERFRNEAQIAAKLEHPSIIPIYSTGVDRGQTYLVMRYVPGRSLASYLNDHAPMPVEEALRLLRPVAAALDYAAEFSVVHRDVKPANIFVDETSSPPRTLLGDFGIARAYEGTRHTATGGWVGTPDYIAPEILKDERATAQADQYSLACVLVECISGVSPFRRSNTAATITAQVTEFPDLESYPAISTRVAEALAVSLEKNPRDRYSSCTEFLDAMAASSTADSSAAPATVVRRRKRGKIKRRVKIAGTVAVTALGLLLGVAQVTGFNLREWRSGSSSGQTPNAAASETNAVAANEPSTEDRPDVLILGSGLADWSDWKTKPGVSLADVVADSLAQDPKTMEYSVDSLPLKESANCTADLKRATQSLPTKAVVLLETPCADLAIKVLGAKATEAPPIYVLSPMWQDVDAGRAYLAHAPSEAYPKAAEGLTLTFGEIDANRFVPMQLPLKDIFEAGVVARHYRATQCALFVDSGVYGEELIPGVLEIALRGSLTAGEHIVHTATLTPEPVPKDFLVDAMANVDCVVTPLGAINNRPDAISALKTAIRHSPDKRFVLIGFGSTTFDRWAAKQRNVVMTLTSSWLPVGPAQDRFNAVGDADFRNWSNASIFDDRAALFIVADLIANISPEHPHGDIPASGWINATQSESPEPRYSYVYTTSGVTTTPWGFVSGYQASLRVLGDEFGYVGGTLDPDLSAAPSLPLDQAAG